MVDIYAFLERFEDQLVDAFGDNLAFFGLQGSWGRGEAGPESDIDLVVLLHRCSYDDLVGYRQLVDSFDESRLLCGFISSVETLCHWDVADRVNLILDTRPIVGSLEELVGPVGMEDVRLALVESLSALNHALTHSIVHAPDLSWLEGLRKSMRFVVRLVHYYDTGSYVHRFSDLSSLVDDDMQRRILLSEDVDAESLWLWCDRLLRSL